MDNKILDYTTVSKMAELSSRIFAIKKRLWTLDRKSYNKLKDTFKIVDDARETTRYYVMSSNEVSVSRGLRILEDLNKASQDYIKALQTTSSVKSIHFIDELNELLDEIEGLRVLIRLSDHEKSFFA